MKTEAEPHVNSDVKDMTLVEKMNSEAKKCENIMEQPSSESKVVEDPKADEISHCCCNCKKQASSKVKIMEYLEAGHPYKTRAQKHGGILFPHDDIGGFCVTKAQSSLYKKIWLKYGHIASGEFFTSLSYASQVCIVNDIMDSVMEMHRSRYVDVSDEMIDSWENKIKMAENLNFNIGWLRQQFENVKGVEKFNMGLLEHGEPFQDAKERVSVAKNRLKWEKERLMTLKNELRSKLLALGSESDLEKYLENSDNKLFDEMF
ncbi:hypothetical protein MKW92_051513 [Papaver armeniacum]|nr:hypothetical protein MKW92_051513 [Papaver armeniacum]